jgi:hypothetical protein
MSPDRAYWYLGGNGLHTGIYVDLIRRLEDEGLIVGLVGRRRVSPNPLTTRRALRDTPPFGPNTPEEVRTSIRGEVRTVPVWSLAPGLSTGELARAIGLPDVGGRTVVLHTRQIAMARLALALKRRRPEIRIVAELEGDDLAEVDYKRSQDGAAGLRQRLLRALERRYYERAEHQILRESDAVICVSRRLRDVLVERFQLAPEQTTRVHVIPTLASRREFFFDAARRERTRHELGLEDRFVVVYSGNLRGRWQVPEKLVKAFMTIRAKRPGASFLVLTRAADRAFIQPHLDRAGIGPADVRMVPCPHARIVDHLCAGDVGLLLRERHPMNEVAAPGKFAEYVLSGLPIVMTEGIGDFSAEMGGAELACVLPDLADGDDWRARLRSFCGRDFTPAQRAAFAAWAAERFSVEKAIPGLAALYRTV